MSRYSALHSLHEAHNARFVDFGGWMMPLQYESVLVEHAAVRAGVGVFDVSHLGRAAVSGEGAEQKLRHRFCNDVALLEPGRTQYTMILNERGGVIDDLMVWRFVDGKLWVMPNSANHDRVMSELRGEDTHVEDLRETTVCLAVQGPDAPALIESMFGVAIRRGRVVSGQFQGAEVQVGGTGYTGERGGEVVGDPEPMEAAFEMLLAEGAVPCGLGARDTLRLEAGLPLWGQELTEETSPLQAGLDFAVAWDHDFLGRESLVAEQQKLPRRLVGFTTDTRQIPRSGNRLRAGSSGGWVTSGNFSPVLGAGIGMGYVEPPSDADIEVEIRGTWHRLRRVTPPFHR